EYIEYAFNVFKNLLEADKTYLRDANKLSSYMFLNLLSLYLYFQVLNMSDGKYSVREILLILSKIKIYKYKDSEILGEIPKKAKELVQKLSVNLEVLRKK
ncbi:MAG: IS1634 family transposase, partial [Thermoplasmata archaeon]